LLGFCNQIWHALLLMFLFALLWMPGLWQVRALEHGISVNKIAFWSLTISALWRSAGWCLPVISGELPRRKTNEMADGSGFFNKRSFLVVGRYCAVEFLPAGRGGEGRRRSSEGFFASTRWWIWILLHQHAYHAEAMVASAFFGWNGGPSSCLDGAQLNLHFGGPSQSFPSESSSFRCQVVRPRCLGRRRRTLVASGEDRGANCVFAGTLEVLCEIVLAVAVIFFFLQGPGCNMYPPILI
jgi:hypothetical protein